MAVNCVSAAERTLDEFKDFLANEKYKEWNDAEKKSYEEQVGMKI